MHSEDTKVINKKEEQKLISDENKNLKTFIDGVEYGVTNNGRIYYETSKGKQIIVCNFFMQLLNINDDLSDNKSYTFNIILQEGRAQKEIVLNNYNLKHSKWIDELGMEYHLGKYAKYKDLKTYISNLIVESMPKPNEDIIQNTINELEEKDNIKTEKDYTLGKNFLLGISRLLEADNNEYIASSRNNIDMSDSSKLIGFRESYEDRGKEEYCLKMDKVIKKLKNFNDIFNEELKLKLNNNKIIYSQLAELGVLIVNKEKDNVSPTKLFFINSKPIRLFRLNINTLTELVKKYTEDSEFLEGIDCKNISPQVLPIYPKLLNEQITCILNELTKKIFKEKHTNDRIKYETGFNSGAINQNYDINVKAIDDKIDELFYEIKKENNLNKINKEIDEFVNNLNTYIKNRHEKAGFIQGLKIYIKQEIAQKQIEEGNGKLENKDTDKNSDNNSSSSLPIIDEDEQINVENILKKYNI